MNIIKYALGLVLLVVVSAILFESTQQKPTVDTTLKAIKTEPVTMNNVKPLQEANSIQPRESSTTQNHTTGLNIQPAPAAEVAEKNNIDALMDSNDEATRVQKWQSVIDKNSTDYQKIFDHYLKADGPFAIDDDFYVSVQTDDGLVFYKINQTEIDEIEHEPYAIYNRLLEELNRLESFGDWSIATEAKARTIFTQYFHNGSYSIDSLQCRKLACVMEITYVQKNAAANFADLVFASKKQCQCTLIQYIWPTEQRAIFKLSFNDV